MNNATYSASQRETLLRQTCSFRLFESRENNDEIKCNFDTPSVNTDDVGAQRRDFQDSLKKTALQ